MVFRLTTKRATAEAKIAANDENPRPWQLERARVGCDNAQPLRGDSPRDRIRRVPAVPGVRHEIHPQLLDRMSPGVTRVIVRYRDVRVGHQCFEEARIRLGFGMELTPRDAQLLVAEAVQAAAPEVEVVFEGFRAPAYCDDLEHGLAAALSGSHELLHGSPPSRQVLPATTDARSVSGPCVCYGPVAGAIHGTDEWVDIESTEAVAAAIAITITSWQRADARSAAPPLGP